MSDSGQEGAGLRLPEAFVKEMEELFENLPGVSPSELPAFFESLQGERSFGLRRNPLKYTKEEFEASVPFSLRAVPWSKEGYFYQAEEMPGKSPYHEMGAYYIQEPSAMIAAELLDVKPGDMVADLCAAPGGKSTQIAGKLQGKGLLVCNEYVAKRAEVLAQNMERMGVPNCIILKEDTGKMKERFPLFFDKVLVDAPCSGEGMFRKEEQALIQWSPENVRMCSIRQQEILENAAAMVRPGGVLVYSTCTFSEAEDENVIRIFLERHPEFMPDVTVPAKEYLLGGICPGALCGTLRMWPHKLQGEGHFAARLIKSGEVTRKECKEDKRKKGPERENQKLFCAFCEEYLEPGYLEKLGMLGVPVWRNGKLFYCPRWTIDLAGLKTLRDGLYLGEAKKGRFEPSHTWAMTLRKEDVKQSKESRDAALYFRGEAEPQDGAGWKGWVLMMWGGKALGWGKASGDIIKNHYPKGLRKIF